MQIYSLNMLRCVFAVTWRKFAHRIHMCKSHHVNDPLKKARAGEGGGLSLMALIFPFLSTYATTWKPFEVDEEFSDLCI